VLSSIPFQALEPSNRSIEKKHNQQGTGFFFSFFSFLFFFLFFSFYFYFLFLLYSSIFFLLLFLQVSFVVVFRGARGVGVGVLHSDFMSLLRFFPPDLG
jgi:hypothetical protein